MPPMTRAETLAFAAAALLAGLTVGLCWPRTASWAARHHSRAVVAYIARQTPPRASSADTVTRSSP